MSLQVACGHPPGPMPPADYAPPLRSPWRAARELFGAPRDAVDWPLAVVYRFHGKTPNPECETFSVRDLTPEEWALFTYWLVGHAVLPVETLAPLRPRQP